MSEFGETIAFGDDGVLDEANLTYAMLPCANGTTRIVCLNAEALAKVLRIQAEEKMSPQDTQDCYKIIARELILPPTEAP